MNLAILGRQPEFGIAELEMMYGAEAVQQFSSVAALFESDDFDITQTGSIVKAGHVEYELPSTSWNEVNKFIVQNYLEKWRYADHKITLGISVYGARITPRDIQKTGLAIKKSLKSHGVSLRLIPNAEPALNTATSHHNKLGLTANKVELLVVIGGNRTVIASSTGAQNITALAARDQARPKTDAFVGMLPPKLALTMLNLTSLTPATTKGRILDPFCGTGVVLQEALLRGFSVTGTDLSQKMVDYSTANLEWLCNRFSVEHDFTVSQGDATTTAWQQPIGGVVCETYLGQPFSAPPSPEKLHEVQRTCSHITRAFLENISSQLRSGTPLVVAIPAWRRRDGSFARLDIDRALSDHGYDVRRLRHVHTPLVYARDDQIVARELLLLSKQ